MSTSTSGPDLSRHLDGHVAASGIAVAESSRWWLADGRPLHTVHSVAAEVPRGAVFSLGAEAPEPPVRIVVESPESGLHTVLAPGIRSIGGSSDDDVPVIGLPPRAAVLEIDASGSVTLRRHDDVRGDDEDAVFGSPTAGRSRQLDLSGDALGVEFRLDDIAFCLRRIAPTVDAGAQPINRTPYRPVREGRRDLDEFAAPPPSPRSNRVALTTFIVPLATGVGMAVLLGRPQFLLIALLAPVALGVVQLLQRRSGKRTFAAERTEYRQRLAVASDVAARVAIAAHVDAHRASPDVADCLRVALGRGPSLWQRALGGPHLLRLRVGVAHRGAVVYARVASGGDAALRAEAEEALRRACRPPGVVPVNVDLDADAAVAVCGPDDVAFGLARSLLAQSVIHHGPEDVVVAAALSTVALGRLRGLVSLPHVGADAGPLRSTPVAVWPDQIDALLTSLIDAASPVSADTPTRGMSTPRVLLVIDDRAAVDRGTLERLLEVSAASSVRLLWVGHDPDLIPRQCRSAVLANADGDATVTTTDPDVDTERCRIETLSPDDFEAAAHALAPCFDAASPERSGALPSHVALDDVVTLTAPAHIAAAWDDSDGSSLSSPIGVTGRGSFSVDLVADGPHALVAGTTGSGKSELLQTWVASMAARHPPERCTFLFIDYKGGATAAPLEALPHVVGSVTNLDPRLAQRSLVSLRAELTRRMELMADRARDIADFAAIAPEECPPRLVIVIDEFATLVKEVPDFLAGVVDVAQRGRSLGIHLVLATQRPTGAVNDDILANAPLRLALRVVDSMDSRSVIGTDDAATLAPGLPGRCFVRCGPGGLLGLQVARATAPVRTGASGPAVARWTLTATPTVGNADDSDTQLASLVNTLCDVHIQRRGGAPHRPWVPELPEVVALDAVAADIGDDPGRRVVVGLADDPGRQRREPAVVDLEASAGLAVFGAGGSGRTTALRTACASALIGARPDDVQVVVFDFASRSLLAFAQVPHARAVVTGDDLDGVCREIEDLAAEVDRRRDVVASGAGGDWSGLRRRDRPPRLLVVIDGFAAARAALDTAAGHPWWELLLRVIADGRGVGIHTLVSADRRNDLPAALLGGFASRLVLRMTETESMVVLGAPRDALRGVEVADLGTGRGYLGSREVQVAVLGGEGVVTASTESDALSDLAAGHRPAKRNPGLPTALPASAFAPMRGERPFTLSAIPIGVDERGREVTIDASGPVAVVGPHGSGRSNLLRLVGGLVEQSGGPDVVDVAEPVSAVIDAIDGARTRGPGEVLLVVDDAERIADPAVSAAVEAWIDDRRPAVICVERGAASRSLTGLIGRLRRLRPIVVLQPDAAADVEGLVGRRIRLRPGSAFPTGRALVVGARTSTVVQIPRLENTEIH